MDYTIKLGAQLKEQLRSLRKARGLSQAGLAALMGVNQRRIADIESDPGVVSFDQIMKLLLALGAELVVRDLAAAPPAVASSTSRPSVPARDDFLGPLPASARHLLAVLLGATEEVRTEAYLWRPDDPHGAVALPRHARRRLIEQLARALLVNPVLLESNLKREAAEYNAPHNADRPLPEIQKQWADALGVTPEALQLAVKVTREERMPPAGLGRPPTKGEW